jgi:hypothetical protein
VRSSSMLKRGGIVRFDIGDCAMLAMSRARLWRSTCVYSYSMYKMG